MAWRKVVHIDEGKCDGCGQCVTGCAEGAIAIIDGKARLVSEIYCDGLGACLGHCPQGAIHIEEREAPEFDEAKTRAHLDRLQAQKAAVKPLPLASAPPQCPGSMMRSLGDRKAPVAERSESPQPSQLCNWPVQLTLVPPSAPYFREADLLLVADCVPFACADFHRRFLRGKPVIIGCPKLDQADAYVKKLAQILRAAKPRSLTVVHMEVPCCSGLTRVAQYARELAESEIGISDCTVGINGDVLAEDQALPLR